MNCQTCWVCDERDCHTRENMFRFFLLSKGGSYKDRFLSTMADLWDGHICYINSILQRLVRTQYMCMEHRLGLDWVSGLTRYRYKGLSRLRTRRSADPPTVVQQRLYHYQFYRLFHIVFQPDNANRI